VAHHPGDIGVQVLIGQEPSSSRFRTPHPAGGHQKRIRGVAGPERDFNVEVIDRETEKTQFQGHLPDGGPKAFGCKRLLQVPDEWQEGYRRDGAKLPQALIDGLKQIPCLPFTDLAAEVLIGWVC